MQITETSILIKLEAAIEEDKKYEELKPKKPGEVKEKRKEEVVDIFPPKKPETKLKKRYFASTELDPIRFTALAGQIGENIIAYLQAHKDTKVKITLEIQANSESGFRDDEVRTISENSNALNVEQHGFEEE